MLIEQIIEFAFKGAWFPWPYMYSSNWLLSWQNKNLLSKSSSGLLFTAKILQEARYHASSYLGQIIYKIYRKMQDFKHVLDLNCK